MLDIIVSCWELVLGSCAVGEVIVEMVVFVGAEVGLAELGGLRERLKAGPIVGVLKVGRCRFEMMLEVG